jgi:hypothetical protein
MNLLSPKRLLWITIGFIVLANLIVLSKAYYNRTKIATSLEFSERELVLPHRYGFSKEDSSIRLRLRWSSPTTQSITADMDTWSWRDDNNLMLSQAHYNSFNFPVCHEKRSWSKKRKAWVLLELNGQSYRDYLAQLEQYGNLVQEMSAGADNKLSEKELLVKRKRTTDFLAAEKLEKTRLFVKDAAPEPALLETAMRARLDAGDKQLLIVSAEVGSAYYNCGESAKNSTTIRIQNLSVESLYLPREFSRNFPHAQSTKGKTPKIEFTATVNYGRSGEPWIAGLKLKSK